MKVDRSVAAIAIVADMIHYGVSKTALPAVARGFAKEAAGTGVTVNSVIAGPTHTGGVEDFVYLASPLASATTGGAVRVGDGSVDAILP